MKNLAGQKNCDEMIVRELTLARIPIITVEKNTGEVPYTKIGKLGNFTFTRAWSYWIAVGWVILPVAKQIFADPGCVKDVRAGGHSECLPPERMKYDIDFDTGRIVKSQEQWDEFISLTGDSLPRDRYMSYGELEKNGGRPTPAVYCYHIDTELGLRLFVDYLRAGNLVPPLEIQQECKK